MRKIFTLFTCLVTVFSTVFVNAQTYPPVGDQYLTLDLSKTTNPATPLGEDAIWSGTYEADQKIKSQGMIFSHHGEQSPYTWWYGFTLSTKTSTADQGVNWLANPWGCMAKGGYDGEGTPYIIAYWDAYTDGSVTETSQRTNVIDLRACAKDKAVGMFVSITPWVYYSNINGVAPAKAFQKGDFLKLIAKGFKDGAETGSTEYYLADYRGDSLIQSTSWEWFNLSSLGSVDYIAFTMESTDNGQWGINTPTYFCLDKLTLEGENSSIENEKETEKAYRIGSVLYNLPENATVQVFDFSGKLLQSVKITTPTLDIVGTQSIIRVISSNGVQVIK